MLCNRRDSPDNIVRWQAWTCFPAYVMAAPGQGNGEMPGVTSTRLVTVLVWCHPGFFFENFGKIGGIIVAYLGADIGYR